MTNIRPLPPIGEEPAEPVALAEARLHVRIDADPDEEHPDDALLLRTIRAAREAAEAFCERLFTAGSYEMMFDGFSPRMCFPVAPVGAITAVQYIDQAGTVQVLSADLYRLYMHPDAPALMFVPGASFPELHWMPGSVSVQFTGGVGSGPGLAPVPEMVIAAILLTVGHLYENREAVVTGAIATEIPSGAKALLWPHRRGLGV